MKKIICFVVFMLLLCSVSAYAGSSYKCFSTTLSTDVSTATDLGLDGLFLLSWSIVCTTDDAVDLTIYNADQGILDTITTTSATSTDENGKFTGYPLMSRKFWYTFENIGGGSCKLEICGQ